MNDSPKPRTVKAEINRIVTEIAVVNLDRDGCVEELIESLEEIDCGDMEVINIISVRSFHP